MNFRDFLEEQLKNPEFRKEYEALATEYAFKQLLINLHRFFRNSLKKLTGMHK